MAAKALAAIGAGLVGAALSSPHAAHADPAGFPDLSGYTPANVTDYTIGLPNTGRAPLIPCISLPQMASHAIFSRERRSARAITFPLYRQLLGPAQ